MPADHETPADDGEDFVSCRKAALESGLPAYAVRTLALVGRIRVKVSLGSTPKYSVSDAVRIANEADRPAV